MIPVKTLPRRPGTPPAAPASTRSPGGPLVAVLVALSAGCALQPQGTPASAGTAPATMTQAPAAPAMAAAPVASRASTAPEAPVATTLAAAPLAAPTYGIEFLDTRLSAAGSLVDLRYRVLDADKAAPLLDRKVRPVLVQVGTGKRFYVPQPPIVGALRQTVRAANPPQVGRTYFMLFANPDRTLKGGDALALFIGEQRVGEFRIQQ
ncbi:MAG: hypothetical protein JNJ89_06650 [Rubrivivax sp.]|nr:hypothetical protein [Rubrivivax sp.]